jgi:DNA-binding Xre family transcriptional regulator
LECEVGDILVYIEGDGENGTESNE